MTFLSKAYELSIQAFDGSIFQSYGTNWEEVYNHNDWTYDNDRFQTHPCGGASETFAYWYVNDYGLDEIEHYTVFIGPDPVDSNLQARQEEFLKEVAIPF